MFNYILKRLGLVVPTLFGIMLLNFVIVQAAPGGPVEQTIAQISGTAIDATARFTGSGSSEVGGGQSQNVLKSQSANESAYRGAQGLPPELVARIEEMYGFDKPPAERFWKMMGDYIRFDFGNSFFKDRPVVDLVIERLPVSISLGLWSTLIMYLISIPLGIKKAVRDGSRFDVTTSMAIVIGYAIPSFLFAVLLIVVFAGGTYLDWFPLRGLVSENWDELSWPMKIADYFWHIALPTLALVISGFAGLTMLTKNSFIEEIGKHYVLTARAKGCSTKRVLYRHVFRNGMLIVIAGFPAAFLSILFTGAFLIETIFSLNGLGLLGFEAVIQRDYPVVFGTLFVFTLLGLIIGIIRDLTYVWIDPRIDFEGRAA